MKKGRKAMEAIKAMHVRARRDYEDALRDGRRERSVVIPAKRGKGSYRRKQKHNRKQEQE